MSLLEGALKFIIGGSLILVISALAKTGKSSVAGILAMFPIITAVSFFFMSQYADMKSMKAAIISSIVSFPATIAFLIVLFLSVGRFGIIKSLAVSILAWLLTAVLIYNIKIRFF